jgi:hypothetical protein
MYIQNRRDSSKFKGCSPLQLLCSWIENRTQSATFHTANVVRKFKKTPKPTKEPFKIVNLPNYQIKTS